MDTFFDDIEENKIILDSEDSQDYIDVDFNFELKFLYNINVPTLDDTIKADKHIRMLFGVFNVPYVKIQTINNYPLYTFSNKPFIGKITHTYQFIKMIMKTVDHTMFTFQMTYIPTHDFFDYIPDYKSSHIDFAYTKNMFLYDKRIGPMCNYLSETSQNNVISDYFYNKYIRKTLIGDKLLNFLYDNVGVLSSAHYELLHRKSIKISDLVKLNKSKKTNTMIYLYRCKKQRMSSLVNKKGIWRPFYDHEQCEHMNRLVDKNKTVFLSPYNSTIVSVVREQNTRFDDRKDIIIVLDSWIEYAEKYTDNDYAMIIVRITCDSENKFKKTTKELKKYLK